ncbi:hydroxyacylglutathione hydrolase [Jannaschia seohaensis]|uniref:Hydroxyacylglutathione hydrolase n=1 Tax=Jannaschia seohaensis TaxID=475081 RepID=A0A2Y9B0N6_9RHOB|nr:hydroxyacylglutathione hydrolase [Jannaschia seohaensis]PWJ15107.1 hydroxyacylglutathione hydrolase [Jannaschia seohaensis]SSA49956.1 hydroxyacylglutathione hydrolase [Jannaschia seohaensis]
MTLAPSLVTIPCLKDNYAFLFRTGDRVAVVDVPEAGPILAALEERGWSLTDILLTHHHWDHVDGVADLVDATGAKVWGNAEDAARLPPLDHPIRPGETIRLGDDEAQVWDVSGHTIGHIAYVFDDVAFTGDSLMAAGCGRLFEGTPGRMHESLSQFAALSDAVLIASGHEYTASNLAFAATLEPGNPALNSRAAEVAALNAEGAPSVPSTLGEERSTNPFLRSHVDAIKAATGTIGKSDADTFAAARRAKDAF